MTSRPGELRHEEFSHCCIHESLLETKLFFFSLRRRDDSKEKFRRTLFYNFQDNHLNVFGERGRTNKECKINGEKLFNLVTSCFF